MQDKAIQFPTLNILTQQLPEQFTPFIGREQDVAEICVLLQRPEVRLLTLTGMGGIGKTRLSLQVAERMKKGIFDDIYFVGLADVSDPTLLMPRIAQNLGIHQAETDSLFEQITITLKKQKHVLLLLDNFEQLVTAAPLLEHLLTASPLLKLLVTSRAVLHLQCEYVFPVSPLTLPDLAQHLTTEAFMTYEAIALFVERVQALFPTFQVTQANIQTIAEICHLLDGVPLALELAAKRIKLLSPQALLARLIQPFEILSTETRALPARHQTLYNTLEWSYNLLNSQEQQLFRQLSVFVGRWSIDAAEAICSHVKTGPLPVLDCISSLLDKSLLQRVEGKSGEIALHMLMTVREYGLKRLYICGEAQTAQQAHAHYYLALAQKAEMHLWGAQQMTWMTLLEHASVNMHTALAWFIEREDAESALHMCATLGHFWEVRGHWTEARRWLQIALTLPEAQRQTPLRARALYIAGGLASKLSYKSEAYLLLSESVAIYRALADDQGLAMSLACLAIEVQWKEDFVVNPPLFEECMSLCRRLENYWPHAFLLHQLAYLAWLRGDNAQNVTLLEESFSLAQHVGDKYLLATIVNSLGYAAFLEGNQAKAFALCQKALAMARELGDTATICHTLESMGSLRLAENNLAMASVSYTEGCLVGQRLKSPYLIGRHLAGLARVAIAGHPHSATYRFAAAHAQFDGNMRLLGGPHEHAIYKQAMEQARSQLGEEAFAAAWTQGYMMTLEEVLHIKEPVTKQTSPSPLHSINTLPSATLAQLTKREYEVLHLVAQGMTNSQIAQQLVVSIPTINTHVASIFNKLKVNSRAAATRYAVEHQLI